MKYVTLILSGLLFLFAGCDRSNDYTTYEDLLIKVVVSDAVFTAAGGEGSIVVDHPKKITATSSASWCTLSVDGPTIHVTVPMISDLSSRHALVTITDGTRKNYVTVTQSGVSFSIQKSNVSISAAGGEIRIAYESATPPTITPSVGWITGTADHAEREIVLTVAPYSTVNVNRQATVLVNVGVLEETITVVQNSYIPSYSEFLGTYTMRYATSNAEPPNRTRTATVVLAQATDGITYYLKGVLAPADEALGNIIVQYSATRGIEFLGQIIFVRSGTNYDFWWNPYSKVVSGSNYVSRDTSVGMVSAEYNVSGNLTFSMVDNGAWGSYVVAGMLLRNYNGSTSMGNVNGADGQAFVFYPIFEKQ